MPVSALVQYTPTERYTNVSSLCLLTFFSCSLFVLYFTDIRILISIIQCICVIYLSGHLISQTYKVKRNQRKLINYVITYSQYSSDKTYML